jgi:hypothetical protein
MSSNNAYNEFIFLNNTSKKKSSTHIINDYNLKYNTYNAYKLLTPNNSNTHIKYNVLTITKNVRPILSSPKVENTKNQAIDEINNLKNQILTDNCRTETYKNKINYLRDLNKINIYLETENEKINDIKPEPLPMKINQNNGINYNSMIQKIFHNRISQKIKNNNINNKKRNDEIINKNENRDCFNILFNKNNLKTKAYNKKNFLERRNIKRSYNSYTNIYNYNRNKENEKLIFVLKNLDLENLTNVFKYHYINFRDLFQLNKQDFLEMDIPIGPRNRIMNFIYEYKIYGKKYDLNELRAFFKSKNANGFSFNYLNDNEFNYIYSEKNSNNKNKNLYNMNNIKNNNHYSNYNKNSSNNEFFNNYCEKKYKNEKYIKDSIIFKNNTPSNYSTMLYRYNSISNVFNHKNYHNESKYESIQTRNMEKYSLLKSDKVNERSISCSSPLIRKKRKKIKTLTKFKKSLFKSYSMNNTNKKNISNKKDENAKDNKNIMDKAKYL